MPQACLVAMRLSGFAGCVGNLMFLSFCPAGSEKCVIPGLYARELEGASPRMRVNTALLP